jgi:tRNA(fMet)-specific endonuclease VapC
MSPYILDTDILTLLQRRHPLVLQRFLVHSPADVAITVLTVEEQLSGWYTRVRQSRRRDQLARAYQALATSVEALSGMRVFSFTEPAILRYENLKSRKIAIGKKDLAIAAVVLENNAILVTRNVRDFQQVPNLVLENWAA